MWGRGAIIYTVNMVFATALMRFVSMGLVRRLCLLKRFLRHREASWRSGAIRACAREGFRNAEPTGIAREEFRDQYARACKDRADAFAEEIIEIDDTRLEAERTEEGDDHNGSFSKPRLRSRHRLAVAFRRAVAGRAVDKLDTGRISSPRCVCSRMSPYFPCILHPAMLARIFANGLAKFAVRIHPALACARQ
jgi:hypothetical protein